MSRVRKPEPKLGPEQQDTRRVVPIAVADVDRWLFGTVDDATTLVRLPPVEAFAAGPAV